jgi:hypothetical protein
MAEAQQDPERRRFYRERRRLTCELQVLGARYSGVLLDLSPTGLFVQTNVEPPTGTSLRVVVRAPLGESWEIDANVVRRRRVHRDAVSVKPPGLGLSIISAPEGYYQFLASLTR